MDKNKRVILLELISHTSLTGKQLAALIMMSDRSIRTIVRDLNAELKSHGACIHSDKSYGYKLIVNDSSLFLIFIQELQTQDIIDESEERLSKLFEIFVNSHNYITIDDLSDQLYLSSTLIKKMIKELKQYFECYELTLKVKPHYGMILVGSEIQIRKAIIHFDQIDKSLYYSFHNEYSQEINKILYSSFFNMKYQIIDETVEYIKNLIYMITQRITLGFYIQLEKNILDKLLLEDEYILAVNIMTLICSLLDIPYIEQEVAYLSMCLCGKLKKIDSSPHIDEHIIKLTTYLISNIENYALLKLDEDFNLHLTLALHIFYLEKRIQYKMYMKNPLTQDIKSHFIVAYDIALKACEFINAYYHCLLPEDEIAFFALHINLALEQRKRKIIKKNILLVCSSGIGSIKLLEYQLKNYFPNYIHTIQTCSLYQLAQINFNDFHCVLTTIPLEIDIMIPIIHIQHFIQQSDIPTIQKTFHQMLEIQIEKYFCQELFFVVDEYFDKYEAIKDIVSKCNNVYSLPNNFYEEVVKREKSSSTEFSEFVAFPHPALPMSNQTFASITLLKKPLLWHQNKIRIIILCSIENQKHEMLDQFYYVISSLITNQYWQWMLLNHPTFEMFKKVLEDINKNG